MTTNVDGSGAGRVSTEVKIDVTVEPGSVYVVKLPDSVVVIVDGSRVIKTSVVVTDTDIAVVMESDVSVVYRVFSMLTEYHHRVHTVVVVDVSSISVVYMR